MSELKAANLRKMREDNIAALGNERFDLGLDHEVMDKEEMIQLILDAQGTPEEEPAKAEVAKAGPGMYRLIIHSSDGPDGQNDVTVQIDGYVRAIQRNAEVVVPESVVHVLENAVITRMEPVGVNKTTGDMDMREYNVRRFNFTAIPV